MSSKIDFRLLKRYEELGASSETINNHFNKKINGKRPNAVALDARLSAKKSIDSIESVDPTHLSSKRKQSSKSFGVNISKEKTKQKNKTNTKFKGKKRNLIKVLTIGAVLGISAYNISHIHIPTPKDPTSIEIDLEDYNPDTPTQIEKEPSYTIDNPSEASKTAKQEDDSKLLIQNTKSIFIDNYNSKSDEKLENVSIIKEQTNIASYIDSDGNTHYFHADRDMNKYTNDDNYTVLSGNRYLVFKGDNPYDENGNYRQDLFLGETTLYGDSFDDSNAIDDLATEELSKLAQSGVLDISFDFYNNFEINTEPGMEYEINRYNNAVDNYTKKYLNSKTQSTDSKEAETDEFEIDL